MVSARAASASDVRYSERLTPSLWAICSAAVLAPMAMMVFVPLNKTVALAVGLLVAVAVVFVMLRVAPVVEIIGGELRAGRAHIPVRLLGTVRQFTGMQARQVRGPGLDARSWHLIRGGIDGLIVVEVIDPDDPAPAWIVSTRTPDRLAAAIQRAQAAAAV